MSFCLCSQRAARAQARARAAARATRPRRLATCANETNVGGPPRPLRCCPLHSLFTRHYNYRHIVVRCRLHRAPCDTEVRGAPRTRSRLQQSMESIIFVLRDNSLHSQPVNRIIIGRLEFLISSLLIKYLI